MLGQVCPTEEGCQAGERQFLGTMGRMKGILKSLGSALLLITQDNPTHARPVLCQKNSHQQCLRSLQPQGLGAQTDASFGNETCK